MRVRHVPIVLLLVASAALAGDPPPIRVTVPKAVPERMPPPVVAPGAAIRMAGDAILVVDSDVPVIVTASPLGLVTVTADAGPLRIRGKFVDGNGLVESRTYSGQYVAVVEPVASGKCELLVIPEGAKGEKDIIRHKLDVDTGVGPRPPPVEPVDPKPQPVTSFRAVFVTDPTGTLTKEQEAVVWSRAIEDYLDANCTKDGTQPGWRRYKKNTNASGDKPTLAAMWDAVKPKLTVLPCWAIEVNGKVDILPLPATEADGLATLKKYKEVK